MILHIFRHEGRLEKKKNYTKVPKKYSEGIFNRTVISISSSKDSTEE